MPIRQITAAEFRDLVASSGEVESIVNRQTGIVRIMNTAGRLLAVEVLDVHRLSSRYFV